jgi:arylformamidase
MILTVQINQRAYRVDTRISLDLSIPLLFNDSQPNLYGVPKAASEAYEDNHFVGDTRRGGSCNFENLWLNPHCNGTHTECVGHITHQRISIQECLKDAFTLADLITVAPENAPETADTYSVQTNENDWMITKRSIENALANPKSKIQNPKSLIVRTWPNDESKRSRDYSIENPPFFSLEAMKLIVELGVKHLLVDIPSLERLDDEGKLANHHVFWQVKPGSFETNPNTKINNTITEMIYVPDEIADGEYLLNLQIAPFVSDASPSRPLIFKILSDGLDNLAP